MDFASSTSTTAVCMYALTVHCSSVSAYLRTLQSGIYKTPRWGRDVLCNSVTLLMPVAMQPPRRMHINLSMCEATSGCTSGKRRPREHTVAEWFQYQTGDDRGEMNFQEQIPQPRNPLALTGAEHVDGLGGAGGREVVAAAHAEPLVRAVVETEDRHPCRRRRSSQPHPAAAGKCGCIRVGPAFKRGRPTAGG